MHPVLLRAAPWRALLGLTGSGAGLGGFGLLIAGFSGLRMMQLALVLLGAAAACALQEPAAAVVSACPVRRSRQVLVRLVAALPALIAGVVLVLAWFATAAAQPVMLLQVAGPWALGFALALLARARLDEPAEVVAPALVLLLGTAMLANPLHRHVDLFPLGSPGLRTAPAWWVVLGCSALAVAAAVRDRRWARKDR